MSKKLPSSTIGTSANAKRVRPRCDDREQKNPDPTGIDAYSPAEMAARVERAGVSKVHLPVLSVLALSILAGVFIAFGGMFTRLQSRAAGSAFAQAGYWVA